ncbi:50S ribosomal protein L14e [Candidatus Woesearchaeota archaeon]|nr:50S ribosomal protein L14e [Candidatus Woesearchaeota archaeon]
MINIGRICVKIAGRDAGKKCVVIDVLDDKFVLIDGATRRRKTNILHLEPTKDSVDIKKNASHEEVVKVLSKLGISVRQTKPKKVEPRKKQMHKRKEKPVKIVKKS